MKSLIIVITVLPEAALAWAASIHWHSAGAKRAAAPRGFGRLGFGAGILHAGAFYRTNLANLTQAAEAAACRIFDTNLRIGFCLPARKNPKLATISSTLC
jgi:hypothetical protein